MFEELTLAILADMDELQNLLTANPLDSRITAVEGALDKTATQLENWTAEADATLRHEKQTLYEGFLAAAEICRVASNKSM